MGRTYDGVNERLAEFLRAQPVFFVGTAPLAGDGHVNVSPKGMQGTFVVLDAGTVAYLDLTGSGAETVAHVRENGRITLMFCAFDGPPRIVRLSGRGEVHRPGEARFAELAPRFPELPGRRSIVVVHVERVADSCGYAVPRMALVEERDDLIRWSVRKGPDGVSAYQRETNATSIDGLPALS